MLNRKQQIQAAEKGTIVSIIAYVFIATFKLIVGTLSQSHSLTADGINNFTDIFSSVTVLFGLKKARKPADHDHPYGHWKAEAIASLVTSFVMLLVGFQVLLSSIENFFAQEFTSPNPTAAIVSVIGMVIMLGVSRYNRHLAQEVKSSGLKAVAKDNFADAMTSLATGVAIIAANFNMPILDLIMAVIVSFIIIKTGIEIFAENTFSLTDGFSDDLLVECRKEIEKVYPVINVREIRGRHYGSNIYIDVTIVLDKHMSVQEAHDITEDIEVLMTENFDVMHTDVHVEPTEE